SAALPVAVVEGDGATTERQRATVGDAAALSIRLVATGRRVRGVVVGNSTADNRRGAPGRDAGAVSSAVAVDSAATDRQGAVAVDAAALVQSVAVVDGACAERQRAEVEDAAAVAVPQGVAGILC